MTHTETDTKQESQKSNELQHNASYSNEKNTKWDIIEGTPFGMVTENGEIWLTVGRLAIIDQPFKNEEEALMYLEDPLKIWEIIDKLILARIQQVNNLKLEKND